MLLHRHDFSFSDFLAVGMFHVPLRQCDQFALVLRHNFKSVVARDLHPATSHIVLPLPHRGSFRTAGREMNRCGLQKLQQNGHGARGRLFKRSTKCLRNFATFGATTI